MFQFNNITRVLRAEETGEVSTAGSHLDFNPSVVEQGVGLLDKVEPTMREQAQAQEKLQDDTGSVSVDDSVVDDKSKDEQVVADPTKVAPVAAEESSDPKADSVNKESVGGDYIYKGIAVEIKNTPEMETAFKDKDLDIDAVNKELYSTDGLTKETREKLDEAFTKPVVDMYLQGLSDKNEAMYSTHQASEEKTHARIDVMTNEVSGGKFDEVMKWANDNLKPDEYKQYADVINGTDEFQIKMALTNLVGQSGLQSNKLDSGIVKEKTGVDTLLNLETNNTQTSEGIGSKEYLASFTNGEYRKDEAGWDRRRAIGMDTGMA